jgi:hypothetical protein
MKPALFAIATLALGAAIGWISTRTEFAGETLPVDIRTVSSPGRSGSAAAPTSGPRIVVANGARHDFGKINRFASDSHTFEIINEGDAPLTLALGKTTCKCTSFSFEKGELAPGERTKVKLEWTVKTGDSMFEQSAELLTNDPQNKTLPLTIHGTVVDTVRPDRTQFVLGDLSANEPQTFRMRIHAFIDKDFQIEKHEWAKKESADHFSVEFKPLTPEQIAEEPGAVSGVELALTVAPGLPLGPFSQTLKLTSNLPTHDPIEIPVYATLVSDISLAGSGVSADKLVVNMGVLDQGREHKKTVYLLVKGPHRDSTTISIASLDPTQHFQAELGEPSRDNPKIVRYPLTITIPADAVPVARNSSEAYAKIKLALTHPQVSEMTVRVRYTVK